MPSIVGQKGTVNMFNYGEYVYEKGYAEGYAEGLAESRNKWIKVTISALKEMDIDSETIILKVSENCGISKNEARKLYEECA